MNGTYRGNVVPLREPSLFRPFYPSSMTGLPPPAPEWLVDGLVLRGSVCLVTGVPGIGKSLLIQQLLTAVALGKPWLDKETMAMRTFGLFGEDPQDQLERRQLDINAHYEASPPDYEDNYAWDARDALDAVLWGHDQARGRLGPTPFWDTFWGYIAEQGQQLIALDTAAVVYEGNENARNEVTPFMRALTQKAVQHNCAIILSAHPARGTPNGYSGSSAWLGSSRFAFNVGRPKDFDVETGQPALERTIRGLKFNYSAGIAAEKILWNRGVFIPDATDDPPPKHALNRIDRIDLQYRLLAGMKRVIQYGGKLSADELSSQSMPSRARRSGDPNINRIPLNDLYRAQQELIDSGMVVLVQVDRRVLIRPAEGSKYGNETPWEPGI